MDDGGAKAEMRAEVRIGVDPHDVITLWDAWRLASYELRDAEARIERMVRENRKLLKKAEKLKQLKAEMKTPTICLARR